MLRKVLIVDDSKINRQMLRKILSDFYQVVEAENGKEALDILKADYENISAVLLDIVMPVMDGFEFLDRIRSDANLSNIPVLVTTERAENEAEVKALSIGANDYILKPYNAAVIIRRLQNIINLRENAAIVNAEKTDALTGLLSREAFFEKSTEMIAQHNPGYYVMAAFDVNNFKVINDQHGHNKGNEILRGIAGIMQNGFEKLKGICCRINADNYAVLYPSEYMDMDDVVQIKKEITDLDDAIRPITFSIGRYIVTDMDLSARAMYDRALLAKASVKARYDVQYAFYNESMRAQILREQAIINEMNQALEHKDFEVWFQPQYNHATGAMIGSEALVRWNHPERGMIQPGDFIPIFEKNGFIYELDKYVWEQTCCYLKTWIEKGYSPLPVSVNVSRYDTFRGDLVEVLTGLIEKYQLPIELLRLEITESAFVKSADQIIKTVKKLMALGFTLEIDDFGSGYSSLNTLKDVPADVLKLDMRFLENTENSQRSGNIVESIVRMAKWLGMAVIAEGVETIEQADYLKSIGCRYIQGYFYAKPMPVSEYEKLLKRTEKEEHLLRLETVRTLDNSAFWDPKSLDTLIFNSYVGGACIFEYHNNSIEVLRANDKYVETLSDGEKTISFEQALKVSWKDVLKNENYQTVQNAIQRAIDTRKEVTCEYEIEKGANRKTYIRATMRVIASTEDRYMIYCINENITAQRVAEYKLQDTAEQLQAIMDNIYGGVTAITLEDDVPHFLFANNQFYQQLGYTKEQFAAEVRNPFDLVCQEDRKRIIAEIKEANKSESPAKMVYRVMCRNGTIRWTESNVSVMKYPGVTVPVLLAVVKDITEQKEAEYKLLETDEELRFLNDTAHELLTSKDPEIGIKSILQKTRSYFNSRKACVAELNYEEGMTHITYEICEEEENCLKKDAFDVPVKNVTNWMTAFEQDNYIMIGDTRSLGENRRAERETLVAQGIESLIAVPLRRDNLLIGAIIISNPQRHRSRVSQLNAIGDYVTLMLNYRDTKMKKERS